MGLARVSRAVVSLVSETLSSPKPCLPQGRHSCNYVLAERTGLEPATSDVTGRHSNQLNYHSFKYFALPDQVSR